MTDLSERPTTAAAPTISVRPMSGHTGAEISGVDLARPLDPVALSTISEALHTWKVVFFRDQDLDHAGQIAFARQFGELTYAHPYDDDPPEGHPEIYTVDPERFPAQYGFEGEDAKRVRRRYSYTNDWHTDVTPAVNPPAGSVLRADVVPEYGGDTTFTNLVAAYEGLSEPYRRFLDGLRAEHRYGASVARRGGVFGGSGVTQANRLVARHPVVRVHPITGERGLFVNDGFTTRIVGLRPDESRRTLELLFDHVTKPEYTVRFRWEPGSVAFWDNRVTSHLGPQDIDHLDVARTLHRVTLIGDVPVGVDGRESELVEGVPFRAAPVFDARHVIDGG
ncbi:MAG TPA: TauD/TfdA family dioxygenase [Aquihabitans sp.]|jgi:taurine dioxygenase|nr:TauD/TfdA family dioxygenase [Aquihabitans sp.]